MRVNVSINSPRMQNVYFRANRCTEKCKTGQIAASSCILNQDCLQKEFSYFDFLCKKDKLQISEFGKLLPADKKLIRSKVTDEIDEASDLSIDIAFSLKDRLDKLCGKDKYVFVSVGTSPAMIAKAMECMGVETKYLPMSYLKWTKESSSELVKRYDFTNYFNFLKKQGISPVNTVFSPKKFIFYDYTSSNKKKTSLSKFKDIMLKEYHLPKFKCLFRSLNDDIMQLDTNESDKVYFINEYLMNSYAERYSSVAHLNYYDIPDTKFSPKNLTNHNIENVKMFNFCIMDKLNEYNLLKENPANACAL